MRWRIPGPTKSSDRAFGTGFGHVTLWDNSLSPTSNDRIEKLGHGGGSRAISIIALDKDTNKMELADYGSHEKSSRARFEPDNWLFRDRGGKDRVWELRLSSDHENHSSQVQHRSTIFLNQRDQQCSGYLQDLVWVGELGAKYPAALQLNGAGFLSDLYKQKGKFRDVATGAVQRAVVAHNVGRRGGYITDGRRAAQFQQGIWAMPFPRPPPPQTPEEKLEELKKKKTPTGSGAGGYEKNKPGTQAGKMPGPKPGTTSRDRAGGSEPKDCKFDKWQLALRADILFDVEGQACHLAYEDITPNVGDDVYVGAHYVGDVGPKRPKYLPADDMSSDQIVLDDPQADHGIRVFVRIPRETRVPPKCQFNFDFNHVNGSFCVSGVIPPAGVSDSGTWAPPLTIGDEGMTRYDFPQGVITYTHERFILPASVGTMKAEILVPYTLPSGLTGSQEMQFRLFYKITAGPGDEFKTTWVEQTKVLTAGMNPSTTKQMHQLRFQIPAFKGAGGHVDVWFMRRSDDTATSKNFRVAGDLRAQILPAYGKSLAMAGVH